MTINVHSRKLAAQLTLVGLTLSMISFSLHVLNYFSNFRIHPKLFFYLDVNKENNIPTLYSVLLLLISSILLSTIVAITKKPREKFYWQGLSMIFLFLAFDEMLELHENINRLLNKLFGLGNSISNAGRWDVFSLALFAVVAFVYARFLLSLPKPIKRVFVIAAAIFVIGGAGIELVGVNLMPNLYQDSVIFSNAIASLEEFFEVLGSCLFIMGLIEYLESKVGAVQVVFLSPHTEPSRVKEVSSSLAKQYK